MSTTYNHIRMSTIDSNNNISILYPESTSSDILVSRVNNTNIPNNVSNIQLLANSLANSAFNNIINDNTTSSNYTWSSYKINNKVSTINFYVSNEDSKLHFTNSNNEDNVIDYTSGSGTATSDKVLQGYTFSNNSGVNIPGTMLNQGTKEYTIDPGNTQTIPEGYHNGNGTISVNNISKDNTYTMLDSEYNSTIDMGISNTYRYVNATNVYNKGITDGDTIHTGTYTLTSTGTTDLGVNHTYRYINTGNLVLYRDDINIGMLDIVTGTITGIAGGAPSRTSYDFRCIYMNEQYLFLLGVSSILSTTPETAIGYKWTASFNAGVITNKAYTTDDCAIPWSIITNAKPYDLRYMWGETYWTSYRSSGSAYYYYINTLGRMAGGYYNDNYGVRPFLVYRY